LVITNAKLEQQKDVILLGAFAAMNELEPLIRSGTLTYKLAVREMTEQVQGAAAVTGQARRPFVMVVCDPTLPDIDASIDHLTRNLRVPAIVSTLRPSVLAAQWNRLAGDPEVDTMFINAASTNSALEFAAQTGRIFSLLGNPADDLAPAYAALARYQIAQIAATPLRLFVAVGDDQGMRDVANALEAALVINGNTLPAASQAGTYLRVGVHADDDDAARANTLRALEQFDPHLVIVLAGEEAIASVIAGSESEAPGARRYLVSHGLYNSPLLNLTVASWAASGSDLHRRLMGINYAGASDRTLYQNYIANLRADDPLAVDGYDNYYDAAHYAMLSTLAAASRVATSQLSGTLVAEGFRRLMDTGSALKFGLEPSALPAIVKALELGPGSVGMIGTLGELRFGAGKFARQTGASAWCLNAIPDSGGEFEFSTDVVRYVEATGTFSADPGTCFVGEQAK
jgi:hypothetical protein